MSEETKPNLLYTGIVVEGGIALLAIIVSALGFYDRENPLSGMSAGDVRSGLVWGAVGLLPMLLYLGWFHFYPTRLLQPMRDFVDAEMRPLFRDCSLVDLALISVLAGFCEELLFRWCLQGGLASIMPATTFHLCLAVFTVSIVFGLCHWVNASYGITTAFVGAYFGWMMIQSGSFLAPAVTHTLFDFVALVYVARWEPARAGRQSDSNQADTNEKRPD